MSDLVSALLRVGPGMSDGPASTSPSDPTPQADIAPQGEQGSTTPEAEQASAVTPTAGWRSSLLVFNIPLSRVQVFVGLTAGLLSISGFLYPALRAGRAPLPLGEVVTVVHEAGSRRPVPDATVEILTPGHVLVTTLTPRDEGRARHVIKEGTYRVRVTHPRFVLETRSIQVLAGTIAEIRFQLSPRRGEPSPSPSAAPAAVRAPAAPSPAGRPAKRAPSASPAPGRPPTPKAVAAPKAAAVAPAAPAERPREAAGVRRTPLREHQSP